MTREEAIAELSNHPMIIPETGNFQPGDIWTCGIYIGPPENRYYFWGEPFVVKRICTWDEYLESLGDDEIRTRELVLGKTNHKFYEVMRD